MNLFSCIGAMIMLVTACDSSDPTMDNILPKVRVEMLAIEEGDEARPVFVDFRLDKSSSQVVSIVIDSDDGTAEAGVDFEAVNGEIVQFQPGQVSFPFRIEILGDEKVEDDEYFSIRITQASGAEIQIASAQITLLNDDDDVLVIPEGGYSTPDSYPGMTLIWRDEFDGPALDEDYWTHEIGTGCPSLCGWGNNELEYYRAENTSMYQGNLVIEAREESIGGRDYTSSRIITRGKFDFKHGRVDIRAALPKGQGLWPALWMLGSNIGTVGWPACGEIDIMEMIGGPGRDNEVHGTAHWSNTNGDREYTGGKTTLPQGIFNDEFHVFSITWGDNSIKWYLDDVLYYTLDTTAPDMSELRNNSFFIIFNVAVGGDWPGSPNAQTQFPQRMIVDYIRVFQE